MTDERVTVANASRVAVAIERYRRDNGHRLPSTLASLVPAYLDEVPADPCADAPLLYKTTASGYIVYGVGHNGSDDGGDLTPDKQRWPGRRPVSDYSPDLGIFVQTIH